MSAALAGGKGAALARLAATFPVPAFFVIAAEALDRDGLRAEARGEVNQGLARLAAQSGAGARKMARRRRMQVSSKRS